MSPIPGRPAWTRGESIFDPSASPLRSMPPITPEWAWGGATGSGIRVAVIDSGIDAGHPALEGCVAAENGIALHLSEDGEMIEERGPHDDLYGHGTACAGIIHSIAPQARITSVRVLGHALTGRSKVFLRGLAWAVAEGYDIINLSLTTTKRDWALSFHEVCDEAYFRGSFVVTAASNVRVASFPSLYSSVASVACNLANDPFEFYANPHPPTEFLAPGIDLDVPWRNGTRSRVTGNSLAAPHISGIAALIASKHPGLRPFELKTTLWATAANVSGPDPRRSPGPPEGEADLLRRAVSARTRSALMPAIITESSLPAPGHRG